MTTLPISHSPSLPIADPLEHVGLLDTMRALVAEHGREAVKAAVEQVLRRRVVSSEATRDQLEKIAGIVDALGGRPASIVRDFVFPFLSSQKRAGIPLAITIEVLDRVVATRHPAPWALATKIMNEDYPGYEWGRGSGDGGGGNDRRG